MEIDVAKITKTSLKVAGAACVATGVVVVSAVVASGAAVGSIAEGFKQAKKAVFDIWGKDDKCTTVAEVAAKDVENAEVVISEVVEDTVEEVKEVSEKENAEEV